MTKKLGRACVWAFLIIIASAGVSGCSARYHGGEVQGAVEGNRITLGTVQRQIRIGMTSAEVAEVLGSPNVVTTDEERREVWLYDKFATDVAASEGYWTILLVGQSARAASKSQRTLTIVVKFDRHKKVRDFAYHTSRF